MLLLARTLKKGVAQMVRLRDGKPETKSKVSITVPNSPSPSSVYIRLCKYRKTVLYRFYKFTFPRKKKTKFVV